MKLTKNTNKATREWVDKILSQLDLVLCEYSYKEAFESLKACQKCNDGTAEVINHMTASNGCTTRSEHERLVSLGSSDSLIKGIDKM